MISWKTTPPIRLLGLTTHIPLTKKVVPGKFQQYTMFTMVAMETAHSNVLEPNYSYISLYPGTEGGRRGGIEGEREGGREDEREGERDGGLMNKRHRRGLPQDRNTQKGVQYKPQSSHISNSFSD